MNQNRTRTAARKPLLSVAIALAFTTPLAAAPGTKAPVEPTQVIVKFKAGTAELGNATQRQARLDAAGRDQGLHLGQLRRLAVGADVVRADRPLDYAATKALLMRLRTDPRVEYAEVDAPLHPAFAPNDTQYAAQWNYFEAIGGINVPTAWDMSTGAGQVVAVLDSGVISHPDLAANLVAGYDFVSDPARSNDGDGRDSDPSDPGTYSAAGECSSAARNSFWHGTHVAGMIGAVTNNATGVAGVAFGAKVQPVRVIGKCGANTSDISDAILWAAGGTVDGVPGNATPAKIINLSLTGYTPCSATTQAAIDYAVSVGAVVIASAGNAALDASLYQPGNCANVITVAATNRAGAMASYSNFGPSVDIAAPGGDTSTDQILSTVDTGTTVPVAPGYGNLSGSSKAAAHVSGVAALARAKGGAGLKAAQMTALLQASARDPATPCDLGCGAGIVNAAAAVSIADQPLLIVSDAVIAEGDSGTRTATFTVSLSKALASSMSFDIGTVNGTALAGTDYVAKNQSQGWAPGITSSTFAVTINGDAGFENDETFQVVISNVSAPVAISVTKDTGIGTITNDDAIVLANSEYAGPLTSTVAFSQHNFTLQVPPGATDVQFHTIAGTGDADLYVRNGAEATLSDFDCSSNNEGSDESCYVTGSGTWHGFVYAYMPFADVALVGSYTVPDTNISVGDASITEGNGDWKEITFTVSLSGASAGTVQYNIATANGTALAGYDYVAKTLTLQAIPAGQLAKTFTVLVNGDTEFEGNETFAVNLTNVTGANPVDTQGTGTITNDDGPLLSIGDASVTEGNSGTKQLGFTVSLWTAQPNDVTFNANSQSGTATVGSDFVGLPVTGFTIPAGELSTTVNVAINGDTTVEANETLLVNLSSPVGASLADGQGVGTITNDDVAGLSIGNASVTEGNAGTKVLAFTATLTQASNTAVTFNAASQSSTATVGSDFVGLPVTGYTIPAGQLSTVVNVTINGDTAIEADETLLLNLSAATGAILQNGQGVGTIVNDDLPALSIGDASVTEGDAGTKLLVFTASLSQATITAVNFNAATQGGTATSGSDFVALAPTAFSIPAGQTSKTVSVTINGDTSVEADETLLLNLSAVTGATLQDGQGTGTIANDDADELRISDAVVTEGDSGTKVMTFTVSLAHAANSAVTYDIATANNTASSASDYVASTLVGETIPAGQLSRTFSVTINGDTTVEANEILRANLTNASVAVIDAQGTGTIINDDGPVLSITDTGFVEGDGGAKMVTFTVTLSQASASPVTYNIATGGGTATAGTDYVASSLTGETIPAGSLSKAFNVAVFGDTAVEGNETFFATLSGASVSLADGQGKATITNDDGPVLSISDASITEADSGTTMMSFTVSLSQAAGAAVTFDFATAAGTALAGPDFVPVSVTGLKIPAGQLSKVISVPIKGDLVAEPDETLRANLSASNVSIKDGVGVGTIFNDD